MENNGSVRLRLKDNDFAYTQGYAWDFGIENGVFFISDFADAQIEFRVTDAGHVIVRGDVYANGVQLTSDRNAKTNIEKVSADEILAKVAAMPINTWAFKTESEVTHMGPMAQDFHAAFGLGNDETKIGVVDAQGVAFGAIQGLNNLILAKDKIIRDQAAQIKALEERMLAVEALLTK